MANGSKVAFNWNVSSDATGILITNNLGFSTNVFGITSCGIGSLTLVPTANATYTMVLSRLAEPAQTTSFTIQVINGVASGWQFIDSFDTDTLGFLGNQGNWDSLTFAPTSQACNPVNVLNTVTGNHIAGVGGNTVLSGAALGNEAIGVNGTNTLFFRFYLDPSITNFDAFLGPPIIDNNDIWVGVSDLTLRDPVDFVSQNEGPSIRINLLNPDGTGGPIDLDAYFGSTNGINPTSQYDYTTDGVNGNPNGLTVGVVYTIWMDVYNPQNTTAAASYYQVWMAAGNSPRVLLFSFQPSDRQTNSNETLNNVFIAGGIDSALQPLGSNTVTFDDFYLSTNGAFNAGVPVPAGSFVQGTPTTPTSINITSVNKSGSSVTLNWNPTPAGAYTYTVSRKSNLTDATWTILQSNISGTTYTDMTVTGSTGFYRVSSP